MLFALSAGTRPLKDTYAKALAALGHHSLAVLPGEALPEDCDVLLFTGGADIHPVRFGAEPLPNGSEDIDTVRDDHEFALFAHALRRKIPVLGICRGMQIINIALGGDIWQDLPSQQGLSHKKGDGTEPLWHEVLWTDGQRETVNSYHHQALRRLGQGIHMAAQSEDGTIEAITHEYLPLAAVQWHPELMENGMRTLLLLGGILV